MPDHILSWPLRGSAAALLCYPPQRGRAVAAPGMVACVIGRSRSWGSNHGQTYLSTEAHSAQAGARFPEADAYRYWPRRDRRSPPQGPLEADRLGREEIYAESIGTRCQ